MKVFSMFKSSTVSEAKVSTPMALPQVQAPVPQAAAPVATKGLPFGGKRHTLTPEDRLKGGLARKAKAEALKAERAAAKAKTAALPVNPETGSKYFKNTVHAKFNFYTRLMDNDPNVFCEVQGNAAAYAASLKTFLPNLVLVPAPAQGTDYAIVLKHRESESYVTIVAGQGKLVFCTSLAPETMPASLVADIDLLTKLSA